MISLFTRKMIQRQLEVPDVAALTRITEPGVNLAYWKRPVQEDVDILCRQMIQQKVSTFAENLSEENADDRLYQYFAPLAGETHAKNLLRKDIVVLLRQCLTISGRSYVKVLLKIIADDACTKFHTDGYDFRLLCTYVGAGTEWVPDSNVNRNQLVKGSNADIVNDLSFVQHLQPFEVAILKGEASYENRGKGIVHRSPGITARGEKRLLLRIDI
jgi:hypothetical protein